eukprot:g12830.t1
MAPPLELEAGWPPLTTSTETTTYEYTNGTFSANDTSEIPMYGNFSSHMNADFSAIGAWFNRLGADLENWVGRALVRLAPALTLWSFFPGTVLCFVDWIVWIVLLLFDRVTVVLSL